MKKRLKIKNFEIRFYEDLLKVRPNFTQALRCLGDAYTRAGFFKEGLEVDRRLVRLIPGDPVIHYNLACSLSLVGDVAEALEELKTAVSLGYSDFHYMLEDRDLENVRKDKRFDGFFSEAKKLQQT